MRREADLLTVAEDEVSAHEVQQVGVDVVLGIRIGELDGRNGGPGRSHQDQYGCANSTGRLFLSAHKETSTRSRGLPRQDSSIDRVNAQHVHQAIGLLETCPQLAQEVAKGQGNGEVRSDPCRK